MLERSLHRKGRHRAMEPLSGNTADPSWSDPVSTKLERIATLARQGSFFGVESGTDPGEPMA